MSSSITDPTNTKNGASDATNTASLTSKGKSKAKADDSMEAEEEEEEDEDEDEDEAGSDEEDEEEDESLEEIDPSAILPTGRRTRGVKVDYTSKEALAKAGLQNQNNEEDDSDDDVEMKD